MLNNFIYTKSKTLFEVALNNGEVLDEAIVFIEDTKQIWNHGVYFDCNLDQLKTVAITGSYNDLIDKPSIPAAQVNSDWNATSGKSKILNKPDLSKKQDTIKDLETIRQNSTIGANVFKWDILDTTEHNGYEYLDLGLPSGTMWATCNVGATKPEGYGGYYAWGEIEEKSTYNWSTYKWCNGSDDTMTKYCTDSDYGTVDNKTVLDPEDDVAHVKWGGNWRMPTSAEQDELRNSCTWTWTSLNGVTGYRVTGPNGNSIFLPAAGYRLGTSLYDVESYGFYWLNLLYSNSSSYAYILRFNNYSYNWINCIRYYGTPVRPVCKVNTASVEGETLIISNASYSNNVLEIQGAKVEDETLIL